MTKKTGAANGYTMKEMVGMMMEKQDKNMEWSRGQFTRLWDKFTEVTDGLAEHNAGQDTKIEKNKTNIGHLLKVFGSLGAAVVAAIVGLFFKGR